VLKRAYVKSFVLVLGPLLLFTPSVPAAFQTLQLEMISSGELKTPIGMAHAGDGSGRLFTIDQRGQIQILHNGSLLPTPFLDLGPRLVPQRTTGTGDLTFDERGLLGLAFHPDYAKPGTTGEGKFYVYYSAPRPPDVPSTPEDPVDCINVLAEYRVSAGNPNLADPTSERILLTVPKPQFNHNGGQLAFGPDRYLYLSTGDGGGADDNDAGHTGGNVSKPAGVLGNAQDRTRLLGKMLRFDVNGNNGPSGA
jgi:glucose/arabinose dehydrogenase